MTTQIATERNRWVALVVLCTGMLMIVLDATVVNVALPSIQDDLGFSQSSLAWIVNAYLIAFGGLLLLAGRLGDLISRRGMFLSGLVVFTLASLACGLAQTQAMLVGARFIQGVGGAMTSAVVLGMIFTMFPEPREQAKAMGIFSFVASGGGSVGLIAGGAREASAANPLIPLRIFRSKTIAAANAIQALLVAGMFGTFFMGSLYLQRILHYSPLQIGLAFLPLTLVMGIVSLRYSERLIMRFGPRRTLVPGMSLVLLGLLLFARTPVDASYLRDVAPIMPLIGAGFAIS